MPGWLARGARNELRANKSATRRIACLTPQMVIAPGNVPGYGPAPQLVLAFFTHTIAGTTCLFLA